jgi:hypothetical protein
MKVCKDLEELSSRVEISMKEFTKMINDMDLGDLFGTMELSMKECGGME